MGAKTFRLNNLHHSIKAVVNKPRADLTLEFEPGSVPKNMNSRPFLSIDSEGPSFWNHSTGTFIRSRPRPNPVIGVWDYGRLAKVSCLERLFNVDAAHLTVADYISIFQDESWIPIFNYIGLDHQHSLD